MTDYKSLNWKEIVERIFLLYEAKTNNELAERFGFSGELVRSWKEKNEAKRRYPTWKTLEQVVSNKGVSWDWLLTGKGEMYADSGSIPRGDTVLGREDLNLQGLPSISDAAESTDYLKPNENMTVKELLAMKTEAMQVVTTVDKLIEKKVSKL